MATEAQSHRVDLSRHNSAQHRSRRTGVGPRFCLQTTLAAETRRRGATGPRAGSPGRSFCCGRLSRRRTAWQPPPVPQETPRLRRGTP